MAPGLSPGSAPGSASGGGGEAADDLRFKEYELARRVGLESISSHRAEAGDAGVGGTHLQLGDGARGAALGLLDGGSAAHDAGGGALPHVGVRTSLGKFARQRYDSLAQGASVPGSHLQEQQAQGRQAKLHDTPLWFEKVKELEGVTEAETLIVQSEVLLNETQLMRLWSREAQGLVAIKAEESSVRDASDVQELQQRCDDLEREGIVELLGAEALAAVINPGERRAGIARSKGSRVKGERQLLVSLESRRREMMQSYFRRASARQADLRSTFSEGVGMLTRFGELLQSTCANMTQNNKGRLLEELHKHGIDVGRVKASDATNKLHRKILLNALDRSECVALLHGELTAARKPSKHASWGYCFATDGPWRVKRYDKELVRAVTRAALEHLAAEHVQVFDMWRALAKVLDASQVGGESPLHETVVKDPQRCRDVLQLRLSQLGLAVNVGGVTALQRLRTDNEVRSAVRQVVDKVNARLEYHGRFYWETHFHSIAASELPFFSQDRDEAPGGASNGGANNSSSNGGGANNSGRSNGKGPRPDVDETILEADEEEPVEGRPDDEDDADEVDLPQHEADGSGPPPPQHARSLTAQAGSSEAEQPEHSDSSVGLIRSYVEPADHDMWMIGVSTDTLKCRCFPGDDATSMGLRSDGSVWFDGKPHRFSQPLHHHGVIGMLLDLNVGSISVFSGPTLLGVAFGVDAKAFGPQQQLRQAEMIRSGHLIPGVALKGSAMEMRRVQAKARELEEARQRESEARRDRGRFGSNRRGEPDEDEPDEDEQSSSDEDEHDLFDDEGDQEAQARIAAEQALADTEVKMPALTVNFGGYSFSALPPQTLSCDSYLSFATEAKEEEQKARFESEFRAKLGKSGGGTNSGSSSGSLSDLLALSGPPRSPGTAASLLSPAEDEDGDEVRGGGNSSSSEQRSKIAFMNEMQYALPHSWSTFPPQAYRVGSSANCLQRAARRFLAKRWRQREMVNQAVAASMVQRRARVVLPLWRKRKDRAARLLQRVWRGHRSRVQMKLAVRYGHRPKRIQEAVIKLQAAIRRVLAVRRVWRRLCAVQVEVHRLRACARKVQRCFRAHRQHLDIDHTRRRQRAAVDMQRLARGRAARAAVAARFSPQAQAMLLRRGRAITQAARRNRAARLLQRLWRGKADRDYARMRKVAYTNSATIVQRAWASYKIKCHVNSTCDAGVAWAVKQLLKGFKAIR